MVKIARATKTFKNEMYNLFLEAQHRILLDGVHLEYEVYVPGLGMRHLPFKAWMAMKILLDEGDSDIEMIVYNKYDIGVGTSLLQEIEPMFHWIIREQLSQWRARSRALKCTSKCTFRR